MDNVAMKSALKLHQICIILPQICIKIRWRHASNVTISIHKDNRMYWTSRIGNLSARDNAD